MEEQIRKLKSKALIVLILVLLAVTWQFLNYITIKDYIQMDDFTSFEVILLYSSYFFLAILIIAVVSLVYTVFRVSMKYNSDKKKEEKIKTPVKTPSPREESSKL